MDTKILRRRAETFRALHEAPPLLVLPNVWDPLGARLLVGLGYPAVATASAAVAFSLGYDDGENITLEAMLAAIRRIAAVVDVPVSADIEAGYAEAPDAVAANVRRVLEAGAIGINLEDSAGREGHLRDVASQVARIRAVRQMADAEGVPLVLNARIDTYLGETADPFPETLERAHAYVEAGADGLYPIGLSDIESLSGLRAATKAWINVYASPDAPTIAQLEAIGIHRLSFGPGLLRASFTAMHAACAGLLAGGYYEAFTGDTLPSDAIREYLVDGPMRSEENL
jgi:2-methylisocitrate lyase-like PEP mutase family enzyme